MERIDAKFGVQVSIGLVGRLVAYILAFAGTILLARVLGPENYGAFYFLVAIVAFLDNPVTGWAEGCRKRFTEAEFPPDEAIGSSLLTIGAGTVVVTVGTWLLAGPIRQLTGLDYGWLLLFIPETEVLEPLHHSSQVHV